MKYPLLALNILPFETNILQFEMIYVLKLLAVLAKSFIFIKRKPCFRAALHTNTIQRILRLSCTDGKFIAYAIYRVYKRQCEAAFSLSGDFNVWKPLEEQLPIPLAPARGAISINTKIRFMIFS